MSTDVDGKIALANATNRRQSSRLVSAWTPRMGEAHSFGFDQLAGAQRHRAAFPHLIHELIPTFIPCGPVNVRLL